MWVGRSSVADTVNLPTYKKADCAAASLALIAERLCVLGFFLLPLKNIFRVQGVNSKFEASFEAPR